MEFGSSPELEGRIGRVCLVFARVEHEAGHVVQAAEGNWDLAASTAYLEHAAQSGALLRRLKEIGRAYPEVKVEVTELCNGLKALKAERDEWAHSAAITDLFLLLRQSGATSVDLPGAGGTLLNARKAKHSNAPTAADVDAFCARASEVGDAAQTVARALAQLVEHQSVRTHSVPKD